MTSFVQKYRPKKLEQMVGQEKILEQLNKIEGKPSHLFFSGPPGVGKTTAAVAITRKCLGEKWKKSTMFMNASDERGIDVIRNNIKTFAKNKSFIGSFKIVILDEADNLTTDAQKALKGIIEDNERNCSFILTANEPSDVIDPIKDRCNQFYFKPIEDESTKKIIKIVCDNEKIQLPTELYDLLIKQSNGSMRKILYNLEGFSKLNREIISNDFNLLPENEINELIKYAFNGTEDGFFESRKIALQLIKDGVSVKHINNIIFNRIHNSKFSNLIKAKLFIKLQNTDQGISMGSTPEIQLIGFLSYIYTLFERK